MKKIKAFDLQWMKYQIETGVVPGRRAFQTFLNVRERWLNELGLPLDYPFATDDLARQAKLHLEQLAYRFIPKIRHEYFELSKEARFAHTMAYLRPGPWVPRVPLIAVLSYRPHLPNLIRAIKAIDRRVRLSRQGIHNRLQGTSDGKCT